MKKVIVVVMLSAAMVFALAGAAMAQLPMILLSGSAQEICDGPVVIDIQVDDVTNLWGYSAVAVYDQSHVTATTAFDTDFFDPTGLGSAYAGCFPYPDGVTGVCGIAASVLDPPVSTDSPRRIGTLTLTVKPGTVGPSFLYLTPGNLDVTDPPVLPFSSLNALTQQDGFIGLGDPIEIPGCTTAIGGVLNLQGIPHTANGAPFLFVFAALLGTSGLFLAYRMRSKEEQVS